MFGRGHEQPGVLIEPHSSRLIDAEDQVALAQFRNDIWYVLIVREVTGSNSFPGPS